MFPKKHKHFEEEFSFFENDLFYDEEEDEKDIQRVSTPLDRAPSPETRYVKERPYDPTENPFILEKGEIKINPEYILNENFYTRATGIKLRGIEDLEDESKEYTVKPFEIKLEKEQKNLSHAEYLLHNKEFYLEKHCFERIGLLAAIEKLEESLKTVIGIDQLERLKKFLKESVSKLNNLESKIKNYQSLILERKEKVNDSKKIIKDLSLTIYKLKNKETL
jgi:hypothetical protein